MRLLFMGTPQFAVPCLKRLYDDGHDICARIYTARQTEKPRHEGDDEPSKNNCTGT